MAIKIFAKNTWINIREYVFIILGLLMYAFAWKGLMLPHQITGGGITGVGALIYYATGIPISVTYLAVNLILLLIAFRIVGWQFSVRTIFGVLGLTLFLSIIPELEIGTVVKENDNFMACVLAGLLMGGGLGVVFLNNGSTGGTDIIAKVINKYRNITLGRALLYIDILIISSSYFLEFGSLEKIVYGLTALTVATLTVDMLINGVRQSVQFFIFSRKHDAIADRINTELSRGVTILDGTGWYSKQPVKVLTVVVRKQESPSVFRIIKEIDPEAFVSQTSVAGVYGQGFDVMKSK